MVSRISSSAAVVIAWGAPPCSAWHPDSELISAVACNRNRYIQTGPILGTHYGRDCSSACNVGADMGSPQQAPSTRRAHWSGRSNEANGHAGEYPRHGDWLPGLGRNCILDWPSPDDGHL